MTPKKEITIGGKQVSIIYCTATENGYESFSGRSINAFVPMLGTDDEGNTIVKEQAQATIGDFVMLAMAGIVAAATKDGVETPVTSEYILYEATPQERNDLITAIVELRNEWYQVPKLVEDELKKEAEQAEQSAPKNA